METFNNIENEITELDPRLDLRAYTYIVLFRAVRQGQPDSSIYD